MKIRFAVLLLLISCFAFSQGVNPVNVTSGVPAQKKKRKRHKAVQEQIQEGTKIEQNGDTLTTWNLVLAPGNKNYQWTKIRVATYVNGEPHGLFVELSEWGDTTSVGGYYHGRYSGEWRSYSGGKISCIRTYDTLGNKHGLQVVYGHDGMITDKFNYITPDRFYQWNYSKTGTLYRRGETSARGREGVWYEHQYLYEIKNPVDTLPWTVSTWKDGKRNGTTEQYALGKLVRIENYKDGNHSGVQQRFTNGVLTYEETLSDGHLDGPQHIYTQTGNLKEERVFAWGQKDGDEIIYDTVSGARREVRSYDNGTLMSDKRSDSNGIVIYSGKMIDEERDLYRYTELYPNGKLKEKGQTEGGDLSGKFESWYENGKRKMTAGYLYGRFDGRVNIWNESGILVYSTTAMLGEAGSDEVVYDDKGRRVAFGSAGYDMQTEKYVPDDLCAIAEFEFQFPTVTIESPYPGPRGSAKDKSVYVDELQILPEHTISPEFTGGEAERVKWLHNNLRYPEMEREMGVQGTNYVRFIVNPDGTISDVELAKALVGGTMMDKELVRATKHMPKWKPAMRNGRAVRSRCVMGVRWVLR